MTIVAPAPPAPARHAAAPAPSFLRHTAALAWRGIVKTIHSTEALLDVLRVLRDRQVELLLVGFASQAGPAAQVRLRQLPRDTQVIGEHHQRPRALPIRLGGDRLNRRPVGRVHYPD